MKPIKVYNLSSLRMLIAYCESFQSFAGDNAQQIINSR